MDALLHINKHFGITVMVNLHSLELARKYCDRLVGLAAGRLVFDGVPAELTEAWRATSTGWKPARSPLPISARLRPRQPGFAVAVR